MNSFRIHFEFTFILPSGTAVDVFRDVAPCSFRALEAKNAASGLSMARDLWPDVRRRLCHAALRSEKGPSAGWRAIFPSDFHLISIVSSLLYEVSNIFLNDMHI